MASEPDWSRQRAVHIHDETAGFFAKEYSDDDVFTSPFRYGRHLIDQAWMQSVTHLPAGAKCLDIGCGVGVYMASLMDRGFVVTGVEPSPEMRAAAKRRVPAAAVRDGSVLKLPDVSGTYDFVYAIEVFRYLNTVDNEQGHREIARVLKPGGVYFGTYVNRMALDGFRQVWSLRALTARIRGTKPRYHVEFETPASVRSRLSAAGLSDIDVHGAMFAPLRILHKLSPSLGAAISRHTISRERMLSDRPWTRPFAGHIIASARKP